MIIFNLATDENDPLLAFTSDWIKAFHEIENVTEVISTHVGSHSLPKSIRVHELGGGSPLRKIIAILKLLYHGIRITSTTNNTVIFHHMSTYSAMILGPLFRFRGFQQGLWYSHNRDSFILRGGSFFVNDIFTPTRDSFPFKSKKLHSVGHGIDVSKFNLHMNENARRFGIVSVGRISEVKRLDLLISGVIESGLQGVEVTLIGPNPKQNNLYGKLVNLAAENYVPLVFMEPVKNTDLAEVLSKYSMCYTGSPKTVDKSAIEGALMGCFVLSENLNVLEQTGMNEVWRTIGQTPPTSISEQIQELSKYVNRIDLRIILRQAAIHNNDLKLTARKIYDQVSKNG